MTQSTIFQANWKKIIAFSSEKWNFHILRIFLKNALRKNHKTLVTREIKWHLSPDPLEQINLELSTKWARVELELTRGQ